MSTTDGGDINEEFNKLMAGITLDLPDARDIVNVSLLSDVELSSRYNQCRQDLLAIGEMMEPKTDKGRELHSERAAYIVEMRRRRMK